MQILTADHPREAAVWATSLEATICVGCDVGIGGGTIILPSTKPASATVSAALRDAIRIRQ